MVVGPRRMEYSRVINLLDFICKEIEEMFANILRSLPNKKGH